MREAERVEQAGLEGLVVGQSGDDLGDAAQDHVGGVGVGEHLPRRQGLAGLLGGDFHVALEGVVAAAGVEHAVGFEAAGVVEQLADRDLLGGLADGEAVDDVGDLRFEVEFAGADQVHDERRGVDLGERADLEGRVGGDGDAGVLVEDAGGDLVDLTLVEQGQARAGDVVLGDELVEPGLPALDVDGHVGLLVSIRRPSPGRLRLFGLDQKLRCVQGSHNIENRVDSRCSTSTRLFHCTAIATECNERTGRCVLYATEGILAGVALHERRPGWQPAV
ncbi:hypothetical protein J2S68_001873 [Glycomyces algeriensis]|uniref:Uncharacterized protein n=1 Tax=Glycomyces algeriensis TaxID=256037 RepID=A0A9W6GA30_9ACTN|nr:hypothetical protein [Glycomyces algeriensis]MDA1364299.1 hypothetical protein [Glycomyces algeriensis]MDR7350330.1 hypothetical protein [Glycomyces algeriensis]GLI43037.1 hypothetical protein GALLR39Z86_28870 [Glycomyces algeriensis]